MWFCITTILFMVCMAKIRTSSNSTPQRTLRELHTCLVLHWTEPKDGINTLDSKQRMFIYMLRGLGGGGRKGVI